MKHSTYEILRRAHHGDIDKDDLLKAQKDETDPFVINIINLILQNASTIVKWDITSFTDHFRSAAPRKRLDETVFAFLLRLVAVIKEEMYMRTFQKPASHDAILAWISLLENTILCTLALLYNIRWTPETIFTLLHPTVLKLISQGNPEPLRDLMKSLGISLVEDIYPAERLFDKLNFLHTGQFSSFYWRYVHWMAEAIDFRKDKEMMFYKNQWRNHIVGALYRTLRCQYCMYHFKQMIKDLQPELTDENNPQFRMLWFDMHNRVHSQRREQNPLLKEPNYTETEYQKDSDFMIQALSP